MAEMSFHYPRILHSIDWLMPLIMPSFSTKIDKDQISVSRIRGPFEPSRFHRLGKNENIAVKTSIIIPAIKKVFTIPYSVMIKAPTAMETGPNDERSPSRAKYFPRISSGTMLCADVSQRFIAIPKENPQMKNRIMDGTGNLSIPVRRMDAPGIPP